MKLFERSGGAKCTGSARTRCVSWLATDFAGVLLSDAGRFLDKDLRRSKSKATCGLAQGARDAALSTAGKPWPH